MILWLPLKQKCDEHTFFSLAAAAFPANSKISAARYSRAAVVTIAAPRPMRGEKFPFLKALCTLDTGKVRPARLCLETPFFLKSLRLDAPTEDSVFCFGIGDPEEKTGSFTWDTRKIKKAQAFLTVRSCTKSNVIIIYKLKILLWDKKEEGPNKMSPQFLRDASARSTSGNSFQTTPNKVRRNSEFWSSWFITFVSAVILESTFCSSLDSFSPSEKVRLVEVVCTCN